MPTHIVCIQPNIHSPSNSSPGIISTDVTPTTLRTNITLTTLSTGATVGITVEVTCAIILFVGFLAGVLLYHCISKQQSQHKPEPASYQQQQADPQYEEVQADPKNE